MKDDEIIGERNQVTKFKADNGNPVLQIIDYINKNFIGDKINKKNKSGANIVKSYKITLIAHKASGFHSYVVMKNLDKKKTSLKTVKTDICVVKLSFISGLINETPQYFKIICSKSHISGSLAERGTEYGVQSELLKSEMNHVDINKRQLKWLRKKLQSLFTTRLFKLSCYLGEILNRNKKNYKSKR